MSIFLGTAGAEPRTMVRHLMTADSKNLEDLELIQLVSFGDAISLQTLQCLGVATFLYRMLIRLAKECGVRGFVAEVLYSNIGGIMKVFKKGGLAINAHLEDGVYHLEIPFN